MNTWWIVIVVMIVIAIMVLRGRGANPITVMEKINKGALVIDVRTPAEYDSGHYKGATNIPVTDLKGRRSEISDRQKPIVVYCASGTKGDPSMNHPALSFDSPAVLAVIFHPRPEGAVQAGGFESLTVPVGDGVTLGGRFYRAGTNNPTILFFHGNGEIVADYAELAKVYTRMGINFMPIDYRGYGRSSGSPTVTTMLKDAQQAFCFARQWLRDHGYAGRFVVTRTAKATTAPGIISNA